MLNRQIVLQATLFDIQQSIMGANQSRGTQTVNAKINHPKFKNAKIQVGKVSSKLRTTIPVHQKIYQQWKSNLQQFLYVKINSEFLLLPIEKQYHNKGMCSSSGSAQLLFQNYPYLLQEEIHQRIGKKTRFSQPQLWYLLYSLIQAKMQLINKQINNGNLGDIRPNNIFISQKGQIKVANTLSWPGEQSNYKKCLENTQNQSLILSPQDIIQIQLGSMNNSSNQMSQCFSIGATVLSAGITDPLTDLYDLKTKKFTFFNFNQKLAEWKQSKYSQILIATILSLCEIQPASRQACKQIYQILSNNDSSIKARKPFTISNASQKIQQIIKKNRSQRTQINTKVLLPSSLETQSNHNPSIESSSPKYKKKNMQINFKLGTQNMKTIGSSMRLTQAILDPPSPITPGKQDFPSLFSSTDILVFKKIQSANLNQPLKRYQEINQNQKLKNNSSKNQIQNQFNENFKGATSFIVQQPIIFDKNRPSDDIQEQITPTSTPLQQTLRNQNQMLLNNIIFEQSLGLSDQSCDNIIKNNLVTQEIIINSPRKIRQAQSFDPQKQQKGGPPNNLMIHSHKVTQNSKKQSNQSSNKQSSGSQFLGLQKQFKNDEIQQTKKFKITEQQDADVQIQKQENQSFQKQSKKVQFEQQSGNSEFLQIEDIDLEHIKGTIQGDQSLDNILIHYKQKNKNEQIIQKITLQKSSREKSK